MAVQDREHEGPLVEGDGALLPHRETFGRHAQFTCRTVLRARRGLARFRVGLGVRLQQKCQCLCVLHAGDAMRCGVWIATPSFQGFRAAFDTDHKITSKEPDNTPLP